MEYEPPGLHYEDFQEGRAWRTSARTIGEAEVAAFAGLSGDFTYLHTDAELAARTPFGGRIAHGLLGLSVLSGLMARLGILEGTIEAFMGLEWRFRNPILLGDTVYGEIEVKRRRITSKGQGLVFFASRLLNQRGEVVQEGTFTMMVARREEPKPSGED